MMSWRTHFIRIQYISPRQLSTHLVNMSSTTSQKQYVKISPRIKEWLVGGLAKNRNMDKASAIFIQKVIDGNEKLPVSLIYNIEAVIGRIDPNGSFIRKDLSEELAEFGSGIFQCDE